MNKYPYDWRRFGDVKPWDCPYCGHWIGAVALEETQMCGIQAHLSKEHNAIPLFDLEYLKSQRNEVFPL